MGALGLPMFCAVSLGTKGAFAGAGNRPQESKQGAALTIHILTPNSLVHVTEGIARAVAPIAAASPESIVCHTLAEGPPRTETQAHVDGVVAP